ncbi:Mo-dependent nitrogenase C-terminal domain-containing protein [Spirulina sp. CS-785/01]|uniref:Mo-dependent nitrogenase C-terminal domain-containing protein n=1 Tax=Spirulina sp. CS-785/01 TaxID=3021716 RepID=UPI002330B6B6|nr:Mo-dependent nitrogenase C-terminal domain-containing protein [Spirulina sp. CS-785/01]MDB9313116.1 Mo-dependent nitrogenase C-terminal domain-containing protein [Spirulina sp. CS-785/01]
MVDVTAYTNQQLFPQESLPHSPASQTAKTFLSNFKFDPLHPLKQWLETLPIQSPKLAHRLCQLIPAQCPFERDITVFGKVLFHIPPLCKLNPFYEQFVSLRFRALCYLADDCGEDISMYC